MCRADLELVAARNHTGVLNSEQSAFIRSCGRITAAVIIQIQFNHRPRNSNRFGYRPFHDFTADDWSSGCRIVFRHKINHHERRISFNTNGLIPGHEFKGQSHLHCEWRTERYLHASRERSRLLWIYLKLDNLSTVLRDQADSGSRCGAIHYSD